MNLPNLNDFDLKDKRVIVRADLDVPFDEGVIRDDSRIKNCTPSFKLILEKGAKSLLILGHIGKYEGSETTVSTIFLQPKLSELFGENVIFVPGMPPAQIADGKVLLLDNVRLNPGEESNDESFARSLANLADFYPEGASFAYVNEAFATSHREHASIIGLPKLLPHAAGLRFAQEVEYLNKVLQNPRRPVVAIVSGIKKDKLDYIEGLKKVADRILVGGRLPEYLGDNYSDPKVLVAKLNPDREDITIHSIESFEREVAGAGTIILAGVIGKYEDEGHRQGTERVFKAIANSSAFKIVGGGDSEAAISMFNLTKNFDWISTGGGAMLEFLTKGTLPGIEALIK